MYKYAQIFNNKVHWIMEDEMTLDDLYKNKFCKDHVQFVDITGREDIEEGCDYDGTTFSPPVVPVPTIEEKLIALDAEYAPQFRELQQAWAAASLDGNDSLAAEITADYAALKSEYAAKREAIVNA